MALRRYGPLFVVAAACAWAAHSYLTDGVIAALLMPADGGAAVDALREAIDPAGAFAPIVYVAVVVVEVMLAPIPGALLYLPGGAIFGGFVGGTLALAGNVIGAALATWVGGVAGARFLRRSDWPRLQQYGDLVRRRGLLVVALLRLNPLTSSDLVSYAAGLAGVPVWRVALGTAVGIAPLCYAQSYASEWLFRWLPASGAIIVVLGAAYAAFVLFVVMGGGSRGSDRRHPRP